jgi:hypothetical protein
MAQVPKRTPPGLMAEVSPGTAFLFTLMAQRSSSFSSFDPVKPKDRTFHNT